MDSWRITIKSQDVSSTVIPTIGSIGAMVIRASKGPSTPVLVNRGDMARIKTLYGEPSPDYPDVWEAMQYANEDALWISAPFPSTDKYGGVVVSSTGTDSLPDGRTEWLNVAVVSTANIAIATEMEEGDVIDGYTLVADDRVALVGQTDPSENGLYVVQATGAGVRATDADTAGEVNDVKFTALNGTLGTGTSYYSTSTVVTLDTDSIVFSLGEEVTGLTPAELDAYSFSANTDYFVITALSPMTDDLGVKVTYDSTNEWFTIELYKKEDGVSFSLIDTYVVSLDEDAKDNFGKSIYIENILEDNDYISAVVNTSADLTSGFVDDSATVAFAGGSRTAGSSITSSELTEGWNYFQQKNKYKADVFMDNTGDASVVALFDTLRSSYQKYSYYIFVLPLGTTASNAVTVKSGYSLNNPGLAIYWNRGKVRYKAKKFWTSLVGRIGQRFAAMSDVYNGLAPAWINENNHGGQLGSGIEELEYDPSETELQNLDSEGINAMVFDPGYGVMITSHKTAQSPTVLSDYSWIPHVRVFDYIKRNVVEQVLPYQIVKLNDAQHRDTARIKGEQIVDPIVDEGLLAEATVKCDEDNNDDVALASRKFVYDIVVKVTPFSEEIVLNFVNIGQTTTVSEYLASGA